MTDLTEALHALQNNAEHSHLAKYLLELDSNTRVFDEGDLQSVLDWQEDEVANREVAPGIAETIEEVDTGFIMFSGVMDAVKEPGSQRRFAKFCKDTTPVDLSLRSTLNKRMIQ